MDINLTPQIEKLPKLTSVLDIELKPASGQPPEAEVPEQIQEDRPVGFPLDALNSAQLQAVNTISEAFAVEPALAATISIAGLAGAIGRRYCAKVLPGRPTHANLYVIGSAPRAYGKTGSARIIEPITLREKFLKRNFAESEAPLLKVILQKRKKELAAMINEQSPHPESLGLNSVERRLAQIQREIDKMEMELKSLPSLIGGSATGAALIEALKRNNEEIFCYNPEPGDQIRVCMGRYTSDKHGDFELLLSGYSVEQFGESRIGRGSTYLANPCISVFWMTQPSLLRELLQNAEARGRGLLARFLFMSVVQKEVPFDDGRIISLNTEALLPWEKILTAALDKRCKDPHEESTCIGCEAGVVEIFRDFHNWTVKRRNTDCIEIQEELGRARENAIRLALGQCVADAHEAGRPPEVLTPDHADRGVGLAHYYYDQYLRMLQPALMDIQLINFKRLREICISKGGKITLRDLKTRHSFTDEEITRTVELFSNQMRIATASGSAKGGRPSQVLELLTPRVM